MTYKATFSGWLAFAEDAKLQAGLAIVADESQQVDGHPEPSAFATTDFRIDGNQLVIEFENFIPASSWFGCLRTLKRVCELASDGDLLCVFDDGQESLMLYGGVRYSS